MTRIDEVGAETSTASTSVQREYNRQRDYLEKSIDSLKRKLAKDAEVHRIDNMRIMQENVSLIREINDLRREINFLKHEKLAYQKRQAMESGNQELKSSVSKSNKQHSIASQDKDEGSKLPPITI